MDWKRPGDLIDAISNLTGHPQATAVIVGDGPLKEQLRERAQRKAPGRVRFMGFKNQSELPCIYGSADVLVIPSSQEAWGLVANEGASCGLPLLVSDRVGCAIDLVRHGENGFTYRMGDTVELAKRMKYLVEHEDTRRSMGPGPKRSWAFSI